MKLFVNGRFRAAFHRCLFCILVFVVVSVAVLLTTPLHAGLLIFLAGLICAAALLVLVVRYFQRQEREMEEARTQISRYLKGDRDARIPCDEEGELYRLFHEVNALAAILNAHAENEADSKQFLQQTIADISHQLKTPLAALNIYNGILQSEGDDPDTRAEFTALSETELERIETLVQNLLKMAKLDAGTVVLEKTAENLSELLGDVEKSFAFRAKQEEKQLLFSGPEDVSLCCDRLWLREAIGNLVKNALDHTKPGDKVEVTWAEQTAMIQIIVQDNGNGIHPEDLPHIFKRFYRSKFAADTRGIGLGLPLAKAVVEAHGGTIEVESDLGLGTRFTLYFLIPTKL